ncbi:MAG: restriction endonuclease subunit S, partial [Bacteroidales bacterium]|nr:restriction endonuclease subunit S [Bacteroidales bacterium]
MTAKDLKNAILQEAVQGKLVPQIASEGNAKDLLQQIKAEKAKLVKEGKIKKEKPLPVITEDEIPFDIPESWCWCKLGDFCSVTTGSLDANAQNQHGEYAFFTCGVEVFKTLTYAYDCDAILLGGNNASGDYKMHRYKGKFNAYQRVYVITGTEKSILDYFEYVIKYWLPFLKKNSQGTTTRFIKLSQVKDMLIPLPPLAEQKRIVVAIEKFMPLIEEYGKKESVLKDLNASIGTLTKKAILQEAVQGKLVPQIASEGNAKDLLEQIKAEKAKLVKEGKIKKEKTLPGITEDEIPFDIPESWCWCRLGEVCTKLVDGDHNPPAGINEKTEYIMASSRNINKDTLVDLDLVRYLTKDVFEKENERTNAQEGDIFFTGVGTLGRSCIYNGELNICFQRSVSVIKTEIYNKLGINATLINPRFITGIDEDMLNDLKRDHDVVITLEDGVVDG